MSIRAVIFDVGGVLLASSAEEPIDVRWERRLGLAPGEFKRAFWDLAERLGCGVGRTPEALLFAQAAKSLGLDVGAAEQLALETRARFVFDERVADYVRSLRPRYKLASLSNSWSGARESCSRDHGLDRLVDLMVFSAEEGIEKPDPEIYLRTLARLGVGARDAVFVDDTEENLEAAARLGLTPVHVRRPEELLERVPAALADPSH